MLSSYTKGYCLSWTICTALAGANLQYARFLHKKVKASLHVQDRALSFTQCVAMSIKLHSMCISEHKPSFRV